MAQKKKTVTAAQRERQALREQAARATGPRGDQKALEDVIACARVLQHRHYLERVFARWAGSKAESLLVKAFLATVQVERCSVEWRLESGLGAGGTELLLRLGAGKKQVYLHQSQASRRSDATGMVLHTWLELQAMRGQKRLLFTSWNEERSFVALAEKLFDIVNSQKLPVARGLSTGTKIGLVMRLLVPWDSSFLPGYDTPGKTDRKLDTWFSQAEKLYLEQPDEALRRRLSDDQTLPFAAYQPGT